MLKQSCVSEAQKYQGALYKGKASKNPHKSNQPVDTSSNVPRKAYVEDAPENDSGNAIAIVDVPPPAPSPPRPNQAVNVFDFLVTDDTPNGSKVSLGGSKEQMQMVEHARPVFEASRRSASESDNEEDNIHEYDDAYETNGYLYGTDPIPVHTPAPRGFHTESRESIYELEGAERKSTDKKRKRYHVEELDLTAARRPSQELDEIMADAPPILHSGLTGGMNRLLSKSKFPPSPDYSGNDNQQPSPPSPVKRTKKIIIPRERGRKSASTLIRIRKVSSSRRASDESRPRKHHRSQHHEDRQSEPSTKGKLKAIEYHPQKSQNGLDADQQLVVFRSRAELFMSFVTKGPESDHGYSINKALKRYHRERGERGLGMGKVEEEKELWKSLRLRRNERGEVVLLCWCHDFLDDEATSPVCRPTDSGFHTDLMNCQVVTAWFFIPRRKDCDFDFLLLFVGFIKLYTTADLYHFMDARPTSSSVLYT